MNGVIKLCLVHIPNEKFIIIDAKLQGNRVTLVLVYGPNRDDPTFYQSLQSKIEMNNNTISGTATDKGSNDNIITV
jgi:hypothetical protein